MGDDDSDPAFLLQRGLDHVADEGPVALGLGRNAAPEAVEAVVLGFLRAPLVQREGRVGHHDVEFHQAVVLHQRRAGEGVAPFDAGAVGAVQEHVHARQRPGAAVDLHAEQGVVAAAHFVGGLDEQAAGATGGVADAVARFGGGKSGDQPRDAVRGVELAGFLAGVGGEALDEVDVGVADDILGDAAGAHVELGLVDVLQQQFEAAIAVPGLAEVGLGVEVDVAEHAFELDPVGLLDGIQHHVDEFADIGFVAAFVEAVVVGDEAVGDLAALLVLQFDPRQDEALPLQPAADAHIVVAILLAVFFVVVAPGVRDVLEEQHHQDVVLVLGRVHHPPEGVAGRPGSIVDVFLVDFWAHASRLPINLESGGLAPSHFVNP